MAGKTEWRVDKCSAKELPAKLVELGNAGWEPAFIYCIGQGREESPTGDKRFSLEERALLQVVSRRD